MIGEPAVRVVQKFSQRVMRTFHKPLRSSAVRCNRRRDAVGWCAKVCVETTRHFVQAKQMFITCNRKPTATAAAVSTRSQQRPLFTHSLFQLGAETPKTTTVAEAAFPSCAPPFIATMYCYCGERGLRRHDLLFKATAQWQRQTVEASLVALLGLGSIVFKLQGEWQATTL